jgi:hypothetical protein
MSKKANKQNEINRSKKHGEERMHVESEEAVEGSARRRLKKLSEVNPAEEMVKSSGEEDNKYLVNSAEIEEEFKPKNGKFQEKRDATE